MVNEKGEPLPLIDPSGATGGAERRRTGRVIHDDRGNARLEWVDVPPDLGRTSLSVEDSNGPYRPELGYNPYAKAAGESRAAPAGETIGQRARRDLRRLSEWIKQMRRLEEHKRKEGED